MPGTYLVFFFFFFAFVAAVVFPVFLAVFFLAAFFVTFFAACFFAVFFFAPFIAAAACLTAFLAAFFLAGACLASAAFLASTAFLALSAFSALAFRLFLPAVSFFGPAFSETSTVGLSCSTCCFSIGSATTAATTRTGSGSAAAVSTTCTGAGSGVAGAAEAGSNAFHSRSAWASRGDTSGYSGSSPTVGRIFQERAHLVPTAFSTTTATPDTSFSRNAPAAGSSLVI